MEGKRAKMGHATYDGARPSIGSYETVKQVSYLDFECI